MIITEKCTGCLACSTICGRGAITVTKDPYGFASVNVDDAVCIGCKKCISVCPQNQPPRVNAPISVFAAINKDERTLKKSSSGGAFWAIADSFLKRGGAVCGCALNENLCAKHVVTQTVSEAEKMRGSKYVQSDTSDVYREIEERLNEGILVLFTGTPCQVAGVKRRFERQQELLFTIDIVCHGVTSPLLFEMYKRDLEKRGRVDAVSFREKSDSHNPFSFQVKYLDGHVDVIPGLFSWYYYLFLKGDMYRDSCYACQYAKKERVGDITLADFWGADTELGIDASKGVSMILLNTEKGEKLFDPVRSKFDIVETELDIAARWNRQMLGPSVNSDARIPLMNALEQRNDAALKKYYKRAGFPARMKYRIKHFLFKFRSR